MMNMMYTTGRGFDAPFFLPLHALAMAVFGFGVALLLLWAFKKLSERQLWQWGWILVVIGMALCLLTLPVAAVSGMMGGWGGGFGGVPGGMMQWNAGTPVNEQDAGKQEKEEADGKALFDAVQNGTSACADLSDDDFELIGEYVMGQRLGPDHAVMNERMQQMMGQQGEEQMHILLGRNATGCSSGFSASAAGGMMNGGMMRGLSSSAR